MVVPDPMTNEIDVTVTGGGVIVEVAVEAMGATIVLREVQVSDKEIYGTLQIKGQHVVLKDLHEE